MKDRSQEFLSVCKNMQIRQNKSPNLSQAQSPKRQNEFGTLASNIAKEIGSTHDKLQQLTTLAKRRTLFDDMPTEINDLTFSIKQSIANINLKLSNLQQLSKAQKKGYKKQSDEHKSNVVTNLQSQLANTSLSFKDVLELRTQNMKASSQRKDKFTYSKAPQQSNFYEDQQQGQQSEKKEFLSLDLGGTSMQQMELIESQDSYIDNRASAIQSIESTIAELGSVFQQLAQMVSEQRDTVQRIDANVEDLEMNVTGAQSELLKYYTNLSTNRSLMIKIFAAIIFFVLIFVLVK